MPSANPKLRALQDMRASLAAGKYRETELKDLHVQDVDGRMVRLGDDEAMAVIDRRIAAIEAAEAPAVEEAALAQDQPAA